MFGRSASAYSIKEQQKQEAQHNNIGERLQRAHTFANCVVEKKRGFKPSDRRDPAKKQFLIELSKQIWQKKNESSNVTKKIDLQKIFTPATDAEEILPKNRKLYASSAFYSPTLHPTVEDQVELARRISHSLSDISNQKSKGQSMYVNRKKRSVKWVHEGCGQDQFNSKQEHEECEQSCKENSELHETSTTTTTTLDKLPLRLLMNPRGQMRDYNSLRDSLNTETGLLSPDKCAELVNALQTQKGRGAELFAKRRRTADKWVVDESNAGTQSPSGIPDYHQYQPKPTTSPSILPAYSDAGKHRVQLNMHQEQLLEKYAKPGLKVVKTPWEAALETGSASAAFIEQPKSSPHHTPTPTLSPAPAPQYIDINRAASPYGATTVTDGGYANVAQPPAQQAFTQSKPVTIRGGYQRDLAYKPSVPQGWKAPSMSLPKELYLPKEIPLESYAPPPPPPAINLPQLKPQSSSWQPSSPLPSIYAPPLQQNSAAKSIGFPLSKPASGGGGFSTPSSVYRSAATPPRQQFWGPTSYQTTAPKFGQQPPQLNFSPSPLPYDKLAKFEGSGTQSPSSCSYGYSASPQQRQSRLTIHDSGAQVRNTSPTPFGCSKPPARYSPGYGIPGAELRPPSQPLSSYSNDNSSDRVTSTPGSGVQRFSANELLHSQNFNNSARGWSTRSGAGCSGNYNAAAYGVPAATYKPPLVSAGSLPFTDF